MGWWVTDYHNCFQEVIGSHWKQIGKQFLKFALAMKASITKLCIIRLLLLLDSILHVKPNVFKVFQICIKITWDFFYVCLIKYRNRRNTQSR